MWSQLHTDSQSSVLGGAVGPIMSQAQEQQLLLARTHHRQIDSLSSMFVSPTNYLALCLQSRFY